MFTVLTPILSTSGELSSRPPVQDWVKLGHQSSAGSRLLGRQCSLLTTVLHLSRWRASLWRCAATALWCDVFEPGKQAGLCEGLQKNEEAWLLLTCVRLIISLIVLPCHLLFYAFHFHARIVTPFSILLPAPCSYVQLTLCFIILLLLEDKADKDEKP